MPLKPHQINEHNNFIAGWYLADDPICDELIRHHVDSPGKRPGIMTGGDGTLDKSKKDSTDITLEPSPLATRYIRAVHEVAKEYVALYPWCKKLVPWGVIEKVGIQHYAPGGGYREWHFERDNSDEVIARRHLVFMTYLNDVNDKGGTEFYYQKLVVRPEKGLTLVWPTDWTFTHRGIVSETEHKYIVTGWFSTLTKEQFEKTRR